MQGCYSVTIIDGLSLNLPSEYLNASGNVEIDLLDDGLNISSSKEQLSNTNKITIDGVLSITIPSTPKNLAVFQRFFDTDVPDFLPKPYECRVMKGHIPLRQRFCFATVDNDNNKTIEIQLTYSLDHWVIKSHQLKIKDVSLEPFTMTRGNILQSWNNIDAINVGNPSYFFPPVWYGDTYGDNQAAIGDFRPFLNDVSFIRRALCSIGWKLEGEILDNVELRNLGSYVLRDNYAGNDNLEPYKFSAKNQNGEAGLGTQVDAFHPVLIAEFDLKNVYNSQQNWYNGDEHLVDTVFLDYEIFIIGESGFPFDNPFPDLKNIQLEIKKTDSNGASTKTIVHAEILGEIFHQGQLKYEVSLKPGETIQIKPRVKLEGQYVVHKLHFYNEPKQYKYVNNDVMNVSSELDQDMTLLDFIKGFLHVFNGKIETSFEKQTVTIYPPDKLILNNTLTDGYNLDEADDLGEVVVDSRIRYSPTSTIKRHQHYKFAAEDDNTFRINEDLKDKFTAKVDLGESYRNEVEERPNPIFNATSLINTNSINETDSIDDVNPPSVYLPSIHTNAGKVNIRVSKRKLFFQWQRQRSIDNAATLFNEIVWERVQGETTNFRSVFFPLGYLDLSLHSEVVFSSHPNQPVPFDDTLGLSYVEKYNKFYKTQLADFASPRTLLQVIMDSESFFSLSYRKRKKFRYRGQSYILKPLEASSDLCTNIAELVMVGELNSESICDDGIDDVDVEPKCANYPQLSIVNAPPCQIITLIGNHESIINAVTFEYRYQNADGTYPDTWTPLPNQGLLNANLCNATGTYQVRANIDYVGECPDLQVVETYDPCMNDPIVFFNPFINGQTGDQCFTATIGGVINSTIASQQLFYAINGGNTVPYIEGEEVCLTGLVGDIQVCISGTINYDGDCDNSEVETCFTFPIEEANCEATTLLPVCVPTANANCFHFDVSGNVAGQVASIEIFYKCGIDGQEFQYIGDEVCCPNGDLYTKLVVKFCNDICPTYCSPYTPCSSTCSATSAVTVNCCIINLTYTNCTNPIIVWQVADIGNDNWTNISGAISDQLNIFEHYPTENKQYRAQIQCDQCPVLYSSVTEIIHSVAIVANGCDLTATVSGITCTPINYIWEKSIDSGSTWTVVATGDGLNVITADDDALYRVRVNYGNCQRTSNELLADCNLCDDLNVTIEVQNDCCTLGIVSTNATNPSYQWQQLVSGAYVSITGETNDTLGITENGTYRLCITTIDCTDPIYSNPLIIGYDVNVTGSDCNYTANPIGGCANVSYQWQVLNTDTSTWDNLPITTANAIFNIDGVVRVVATFGNCIIIEGLAFNVTCDPCNPNIVIGNEACTINLLTLTGCDNATYKLQRFNNIEWVDVTGVTSLPHTVDQDGDYRIEVVCDCGTFYSNEISITCCTTLLEIFISSCILFVQQAANCGSSSSNQWQRSCDNGVTWTTVGNGSNHPVSDDCWYRLKRSNGFCECISNVIIADCASGCSGAIAQNIGTCEVDYTLPCPTGSWALQRLVNGNWQAVTSGTGTIPTNFQITTNGTYRLSITCDNGCSYVSGNSVFNNCGNNPCDSSVTLDVTNCVLVATVVNCANPIYTFKLNGNTLQTGSNNSLAVNQDGLYTVDVTGCPDCPVISANENVTGCDPSSSCDCVASIVETGCGLLVSSTTGCNGYGGTWQFSTNGASGWNVVAGTTSTYQATQNGFYRLVRTKSGCQTVFSNIIQVTCIVNCTPNLTIAIINDGCAIKVDWSGCEITPSIAEWNYSTNGANNCGACNGWTLQSDQVTTSFNNNGTGTSTIVPSNGSACYRFVLQCCNDGSIFSVCLYWDEGNCIVEQERLVFQNVNSTPTTIGNEYDLDQVLVNGVNYVPTSVPFTPMATETFDGFLFETSFRDKINGLSIPNFTIRLATAIERAMITSSNSIAKQGSSAVVNYVVGQSWTIKYSRAFGTSLWEFEITESSNNVVVTENGTITYDGDPETYFSYWWYPDIAL